MNENWTKLHEALAVAYVKGWYAGRDGAASDDGKIKAAEDGVQANPELVAATQDAHYSAAPLIAELAREREKSKALLAALKGAEIELCNAVTATRSGAETLWIGYETTSRLEHARDAIAKAEAEV